MKIIPSVRELRQKGYKVKIQHRRMFFRFDPFTGKKTKVTTSFADKSERFKEYFLDANGGETHVEITDLKGNKKYSISECSKFDNYVKAVGVKKSIAKCLSKLG